MGRLPSGALSILVLPNPYSTPLRPLPSSPGRIPPDLGSCRLLGVFIMRPCLPYRHGNCLAAGLLRSPDITPLLRYCEPIRHRLAFARFPGFAGYTIYLAPPISRWDEDGFSSCSTCPCHRAVLPPRRSGLSLRSVCAMPCCLRPTKQGSAFGLILSRPLLGSLALRPGDSLTILTMAWSVGFIRFVSST